MKKLTGSPFLKDLISTCVLMLLNFVRKLVLYIFMIYIYIYIYRQSGQNHANTTSSVLKLKHPSRNTCSGLKKISYLTPIVWNSLSTDLKLVNNFKHKLKDHFFQKLRNMEQNTFAYGHCIRNLTVIFSINLSTISLSLSTIHIVIMFYVNIFR